MADTRTTEMSNLVQTAYDKYVEFELRSHPLLRAVVDKRPVQVDKPGTTVVFQKYQDLATATTPLTEGTEVTPVAVDNTTTTSVTLNEYGNVVTMTEKLELVALSDVDPAIANMIAYNQVDTIDALVSAVLRGGSNVVREIAGTLTAGGATNTVTADDFLQTKHIRYAVQKLRGNAAVPRKGSLYWVGIHPDVSADLRGETGAGGWRTPHEYSAGEQIWTGEIGTYEGAFFVESPRLYVATDGASSARVHRTIIAGKQALVEATAREPGVVLGPVTDNLLRERPIGWKGLLGWARYREEALYRIETSSEF